jgi:multiple sugar transport system permease protein/raffinose/stachyose/melibiose transport system permease protein
VGTMAGPAVALFTVLLIIPLIMGIYYSFTDWTSFSSTVHFVGLANYRRVFNDSDGMMQALIVTGILSLACTVAINVLAVALAMLMNRRGRIYTYYRAAIFYPYVVSAIISGFLWNAILSPQGAAEHLLQSLGLSQEPFLTNGNWALGSVIAVTIWNSAGFSVVLYLAGLQTIPKDVVEAGEVDGAGPWQRFRHIIWPLLSPTVTINIVLILIGMFQTYALVLALTDGGPAGETETIGYQILAVGYANGELGYACAGAVVLLIGTCVLAAAVVVYRRRKEVSLA